MKFKVENFKIKIIPIRNQIAIGITVRTLYLLIYFRKLNYDRYNFKFPLLSLKFKIWFYTDMSKKNLKRKGLSPLFP